MKRNDMAIRKIFEAGVDSLDPQGRFIYLGEDDAATTKKRKVIVRDSITGDEFSCIYDKVRQGDVVPPSEKGTNKAKGYSKTRKYAIGDIVGKDDSIRIVGEMESFVASNGNMTRKFIFRNLKTGYLFDNTIDDVVKGKVTGARSKKTETDYKDYDILSEDDTSKLENSPVDVRRDQWKSITREELSSLITRMSSAKIAQMYNVSFQTVCRKLNKLGIDNPNKN